MQFSKNSDLLFVIADGQYAYKSFWVIDVASNSIIDNLDIVAVSEGGCVNQPKTIVPSTQNVNIVYVGDNSNLLNSGSYGRNIVKWNRNDNTCGEVKELSFCDDKVMIAMTRDANYMMVCCKAWSSTTDKTECREYSDPNTDYATQQWSITIPNYYNGYNQPFGLVYASDGLTAFVSILE